MRYIRPYNKPYDLDSILSDIRDMLLDMSDIGFSTNVSEDEYLITIKILRLNTGLNIDHEKFITSKEDFNTLKDTLNRIKEYGREVGYLVEKTWIDKVNNYINSQVDMDSKIIEFNKLMISNRNIIYIKMYARHR